MRTFQKYLINVSKQSPKLTLPMTKKWLPFQRITLLPPSRTKLLELTWSRTSCRLILLRIALLI